MKKFLALTLSLAMALSLAACGGSGSGSASSAPAASSGVSSSAGDAGSSTGSTSPPAELTTVEAGKLIMSTNAAFPPYEMTDDSGNVVGIDAEIAGAIADKLGLELVIDDMDSDGALIAVQQGMSDMVLAGLTYDEERDLVMDFSDTYANGVQVVIVPEDSDIATLDDLSGKLIGVQRGTTGWSYTTGDYGEDAVQAYDDGATAVQALLAGQIDCVVIDNAPAQEYVAANEGLKILDTEYANEDYCLAVNEGNTALLNALNTALNELIADGTVQSILDKYISAA